MSSTAGGSVEWHAHFREQFARFLSREQHLFRDPPTPPLVINPRDMKTHVHRLTRERPQQFYSIAKNRKNANGPQQDNGGIIAVFTQWNITQWQTGVTTAACLAWTNFTDTVLSERGQTPKVQTVWFHLYDGWKQVHLIPGDRNQNSDCLRGLTRRGTHTHTHIPLLEWWEHSICRELCSWHRCTHLSKFTSWDTQGFCALVYVNFTSMKRMKKVFQLI